MSFNAGDENDNIIVCVLPIFIAVEGDFVDEVSCTCARRVARAVKHASLIFEFEGLYQNDTLPFVTDGTML
eukprot:scaffold85022_cov44-Cyclotella_meneghiniana.AAC.1